MLDDGLLDTLTVRFYEKADADPILGPILAKALPPGRRAEHFAIFRDFWSRILLGSERYGGNAFKAHEGLPLAAEHFTRWLEIFGELAGELLPAAAAAKALAQARHMSDCLQGKPSHHHAAETKVAWPLGRAVKADRRLTTVSQGGGCGCGSH